MQLGSVTHVHGCAAPGLIKLQTRASKDQFKTPCPLPAPGDVLFGQVWAWSHKAAPGIMGHAVFWDSPGVFHHQTCMSFPLA